MTGAIAPRRGASFMVDSDDGDSPVLARFGDLRADENVLAAHLQSGHPSGHVPFSGAVHFAPDVGPGPGTSQQSVPAAQHSAPQQNSEPLHTIAPAQGGSWQTPLPQNGLSPRHVLPQTPQLWMSFCKLTQPPPQHVKPASQAGGQATPPVDELALDDAAEPVDDIVDAVDDVVVVAPPAPAVLVVSTPPQPTTSERPSALEQRRVFIRSTIRRRPGAISDLRCGAGAAGRS